MLGHDGVALARTLPQRLVLARRQDQALPVQSHAAAAQLNRQRAELPLISGLLGAAAQY